MRSVITGSQGTSTGYYYYMDGYDFIAKTGTAQVANENGKGYSDSIVVRGLAGMFPGEDPQVLLYMAIKSENCATANVETFVKSIVKNTSKYLEIYDETKENVSKLQNMVVDSYIDKDVSSIQSLLKSNQIDAIILGDGDKIVAQYPKEGEKINKIDKVFLLTNGKKIKMPNLTGYSVRDFYSFIELVKIPYKKEGIGYIVSQNISEGTIINKESNLEVKFEAKY